jgi:putative ABC transport system ATP-binding protein
MGENTRQNCTRQNKKKNPGRQQPCWGSLFCTNLTQPTGALDTKAARLLMEKLQEVNQVQGRTILMVTHDPNAASFCSRILFIQDGVIFHELRRKVPTETREEFYARILQVMAQMGGGSANVL